MASNMPIDLDQPIGPFKPAPDLRPRIPEPLPVKLVAVADMRIKGTTGMRLAFDGFYMGVLGFGPVDDPEAWAYQTENFQLIVEGVEGLVERLDYRPVPVVAASLAAIIERLNEREIPFERQRGLQVGQFSLRVLDPSGNGVEVSEEIRIL
jgi:hypothetical protein